MGAGGWRGQRVPGDRYRGTNEGLQQGWTQQVQPLDECVQVSSNSFTFIKKKKWFAKDAIFKVYPCPWKR